MILDQVRITILVENSVNRRGLLAEHGVSFLVETSDQKILWDTGQGFALKHNAEKLGVDFQSLNVIALSHGHYDHTGGLLDVLAQNKTCPIYLHPDAISPKYSNHKNIGSPLQNQPIFEQYSERLIWTEKTAEIRPGIFVTGAIPRLHPLENTGGQFSCDPEHFTEDLLRDDQALFMEVSQGIIVLLGCAHSGVINTLDYIAQITGKKEFYAIIGGTHLLNASEERLKATVETFERYSLQMIGANHCTGFKAVNYLVNYFGDRFIPCSVGTRLEF
jgi:7,8-dihydropterin-6-yl-methyl-4-(beta-D-ribofuranosyl)aminobenzene 5'-phosphate synthase